MGRARQRISAPQGQGRQRVCCPPLPPPPSPAHLRLPVRSRRAPRRRRCHRIHPRRGEGARTLPPFPPSEHGPIHSQGSILSSAGGGVDVALSRGGAAHRCASRRHCMRRRRILPGAPSAPPPPPHVCLAGVARRAGPRPCTVWGVPLHGRRARRRHLGSNVEGHQREREEGNAPFSAARVLTPAPPPLREPLDGGGGGEYKKGRGHCPCRGTRRPTASITATKALCRCQRPPPPPSRSPPPRSSLQTRPKATTTPVPLAAHPLVGVPARRGVAPKLLSPPLPLSSHPLPEGAPAPPPRPPPPAPWPPPGGR